MNKLDRATQIKFLGYAMEPEKVGAINRPALFYHSVMAFIKNLREIGREKLAIKYLEYLLACGTEWLDDNDFFTENDWTNMGLFANLYLVFLEKAYNAPTKRRARHIVKKMLEDYSLETMIYEALYEHELEAA